jgi:hypothetical protein
MEVGYLVDQLREARAQTQLAKLEEKKIETQLIELMNESKMRSAVVDYHDGFSIKASVVSAERTSVDEVSLRKALGAREFNKLTVRKLDKHKLEDAIKSSSVDPVIVAQCTTFVANSPYVRITESVER